MERSTLLAHIRKTHFAPGDRGRAMADALEIATFLKQTYDVRVMGVGSLFDPDLAFRETSDIDLVVVGMPAGSFFEASAKAAKMTAFKLDVIPLEDATEYMREVALSGGTEL